MKINEYIKENWNTLPKSKFDDLELVMFHEIHNSDGEYGHHSYEGYGVDQDGKYRWMFSSGCSCNGGPSENDTIKSFVIDGNDILQTDPTSIDYEKLSVNFSTY